MYQITIVTHKDVPPQIDEFVAMAKEAFEPESDRLTVADVSDYDTWMALPFVVHDVPAIIVHDPDTADFPMMRIGSCPEAPLENWATGIRKSASDARRIG